MIFFVWFLVFVDEAKRRLLKAGYERISEREDWKLEAGKKYFFTRNHSTIVAFAIGKKYVNAFDDFLLNALFEKLMGGSKI